jgi:hypothetical protein
VGSIDACQLAVVLRDTILPDIYLRALHAVGATAAVLTARFGIKAFTDTTHADHYLMPLQEPRSFSSFDEVAQEAPASRLYGGIHFSFDNDDGLASGHCIGQAIIDRVRFSDEDND